MLVDSFNSERLDRVSHDAVVGPISLAQSDRALALEGALQRLVVIPRDLPDGLDASLFHVLHPILKLERYMRRDGRQVLLCLLGQDDQPNH